MLVKNGSALTRIASPCCSTAVEKAVPSSIFGARLNNNNAQSDGLCRSLDVFLLYASNEQIVGIEKKCYRDHGGYQFAQQFQTLCHQFGRYRLTPVALRSGRFKFITRPTRTGSNPPTKRMGIVDVLACAARAETMPPVAAISATLRLTNSVASAGNRSYWPPAQRYSTATLRPSAKPSSFSPE